MMKVLISMQWLDKHVINDFHCATELVGQHRVDKSLIGCTSIFQPKGHDFVAEDAPLGDELSFFLIIWAHEDLVVAWKGIHKAK